MCLFIATFMISFVLQKIGNYRKKLFKTYTIYFLLIWYTISVLFLELARSALFLFSSPFIFILRMISSMVVLAPHGEVAKSLPVVRFATNKLLVSVDAVVEVELLATILAGKQIATVLANFVMVRHW